MEGQSYSPKYGEWLVNNIGYYDFLGPAAEQLKKEILAIENVYDNAVDPILKRIYQDFISLYKPDVFDTAYGYYTEGILANDIRGALVVNKYGLLAPIGLVQESHRPVDTTAVLNYIGSESETRIRNSENELLGEMQRQKAHIEQINNFTRRQMPSKVRALAIIAVSALVAATAIYMRNVFFSFFEDRTVAYICLGIIALIVFGGIKAGLKELSAVKRHKEYDDIKKWAVEGNDGIIRKPILQELRFRIEEKIKDCEGFVLGNEKKNLTNYFEELADRKTDISREFSDISRFEKKAKFSKFFFLIAAFAFLLFSDTITKETGLDRFHISNRSANSTSRDSKATPEPDTSTPAPTSTPGPKRQIANAAVQIKETEATSYLTTSKGSWPASNTVDGDTDTCWQDGVNGNGVNEKLTYYLEKPAYIVGMSMVNGRVSSESKYWANGRIAEVTVAFYLGEEKVGTIKNFAISDAFSTTPVEYKFCDELMENAYYCDQIRVKVTGVYDGSKYEDLCLTEIKFFEGIYSE
ncbi:MAG: hypothetical protein K6E85_02020 [Lachnospiraceae bacterium]|nr:hypothetical protein [Lachnospiraceae bacterium]